MERAIVTVKHELLGTLEQADVDVPAEVPSERLTELLAAALFEKGRPGVGPLVGRLTIRVERPDGSSHELGDDQSLADVDAWDGSVIRLQAGVPTRPPLKVGPVQHWTPLEVGPPGEGDPLVSIAEADGADRPNGSGYVRRRLD